MVKRTRYATFAANNLLQFMIWTTTSWNNMEKINLAAIFCKKPVHFLRKIRKETNYRKNISDISCINVTKALDYSQPFKGQERLLKAKGGECRLTIYKYIPPIFFSLTFEITRGKRKDFQSKIQILSSVISVYFGE